MQRSKLSLKQTLKSQQPSVEAGGGGGGIGKKVINGGGGGGDEDDDDEYFEEDDGEDPNESKWWHKVPLTQLYDAATVRAVLSVRILWFALLLVHDSFRKNQQPLLSVLALFDDGERCTLPSLQPKSMNSSQRRRCAGVVHYCGGIAVVPTDACRHAVLLFSSMGPVSYHAGKMHRLILSTFMHLSSGAWCEPLIGPCAGSIYGSSSCVSTLRSVLQRPLRRYIHVASSVQRSDV